jgi:hypothetical protein
MTPHIATIPTTCVQVNFSYFPDPGEKRWFWESASGELVGQDDEAVGVLAALSAAGLHDPAKLAVLTLHELESAVSPAPGAGRLPLLEWRLACLVELGRGVVGVGGVDAFLAKCDGSAVAFVNNLVAIAPSFHDVRASPVASPSGSDNDSEGNEMEKADSVITFAKRAQLCASMLHGCGAATFTDIHRLTVFSE